MQSSTRFMTWNVKGLGHVVKRKKILTFLKKEKVTVAMLQETHLSDSEHLKLNRDWVGQVYYSSCTVNPRKRGTVILISKHLPFIFENEIRDPEGRFILVTGHLFGQHITILNVYAPNEDSPKFISKIILLFNEHCKGLGICAGDFNCVMDERLDKSSSGTIVTIVPDPLWFLKNYAKILV